jgi:glycine/D-amino acid oxidase-like deaminating enzyme
MKGNIFDEKLGIRRRKDGGYTVAHGSILDHSITPATFRYAFKFLPALLQEFKVLRLSIGRDFFDELTAPRHWRLDDVSPFEKTRVLNPPPNAKILAAIRRNMGELFPALADVPLVESWAGMVETSPDVVPMIGEVGDVAGFHIATGFSGHGFGIGPGAGRALAAMLTGAEHTVDLTPFRLSRFFDGSPIRPMSTI